MTTTILTEALRALDPASFTWKFALYSMHKSRDDLELEWSLCKMQGIPGQIDELREYLLKKPVADKPVTAYSPVLSDKDNIGAIDRGDDLIREQAADIILNIQKGQAFAPEDFRPVLKP